MKSWILILAILATSPAVAHAVEPIEGDEKTHTAPRRAVMEVEGERGVWFRDDVVELITQDKAELIEQRKAAVQADSALVAEQQVTDACQAALEFSEGMTDKAVKAAALQSKRARLAEDDENGWFAGKPMVWVVIGTIGSLVIAVVVDKIQENPN